MKHLVKIIVVVFLSAVSVTIMRSCKELTIPDVTTISVSGITQTSAVSGGNVRDDGGADVIKRGICWDTSQNPTTALNISRDGSGTGIFTCNISGLTPDTKYYIRAWASNSVGIGFGNEVTFTTNPILLTSLTTTGISSVTQTTAVSGGNITDDGGGVITASGICWSTSTNPDITGPHSSDGTGAGDFFSNLTSLLPNTTYYVRAYAINNAGISYGNEVSFTTNPVLLATLTTDPVSSVTIASVVSGGNIISDGGGPITSRGVCWSTSQNPTTGDSKTTNGSGTGSFISEINDGLTVNTTYFVAAYAINDAGVSYGNQQSFTLWINVPDQAVTDVDGNSYSSVKIGNQIWMGENLKATRYTDSTVISFRPDGWAGTLHPWKYGSIDSSGKYCWYNNDSIANKNTFGAIYNWFVVTSEKLCPPGWHVPSDVEWTILTDFLGGESIAGDKLKEAGTEHWISPDSEATNESGFTALPGGFRNRIGEFMSLGTHGLFWTSTLNLV